jgi:transposase InsO family protein
VPASPWAPTTTPSWRGRRCVGLSPSVAGVVFHSDQGGEYTGRVFAHACRSAGVTQSMGRTGSALDNAVAGEAFNSTLEWELLRQRQFTTREQWPRGSMSTTPNVGTPPTACSAPSPTNTPTQPNHSSHRRRRIAGVA